MGTFLFRPANRSEAKPLIGLYSESGGGKTYSSLLLAKGFAEDMSLVGMIETESGRGEVFADDPIVGGYRVLSLRDDFSPKTYGGAIDAANHARLRALIIDSASHEWEGVGGVLGMAAANQASGKKGPLVWQQPKIDHQREFMLRLMQTPIPLVIVCMRAKYPMKEVIKNGKKEWERSTELEPKQSEDILFEMMVHAWIDKEHNLHPTKYTRDALREIFTEGKPITVDTGKRLAEWAKGGTAKPAASESPTLKPGSPLHKKIEASITEAGIDRESFKTWLYEKVKIELKDGQPSLSTMTEKDAQNMVDKWSATVTAYNTWKAKAA